MLNEALRLVRVYHDLSQSELCVGLSLSRSYLKDLEEGNAQPTLDVLQRYSDHFGIAVSSLLFFSENFHQAGLTTRLRLWSAKTVLSLLQWIEAKGVNKSSSRYTR